MSTPTPSTPSITFTDPGALNDLGRYASRARALDEDAAVRLQISGPVLAAYVGVLPGSGLLGEGLVLGLRTFRIDSAGSPGELDLSVPAAAITDRVNRTPGATTLPVPPAQVHPTWSSITPPRSGWEYAGVAEADDLAAVARDGLDQVSAAVKERGAAAGFTKQQVWAQEVTFNSDDPDAAIGLGAGVALAAYALGFLTPGGQVQVFRTNRWTRVSGPGGHVLAR
ncbi:MAG: hypothetical protein GX344_01290 [Intrasporangiaceae bacterium]|nr:hypothetical protein [Intrasporangiaceae bacterium]